MNVFETSNQILRLNKLIDHLEWEMNAAHLSISALMERIEENENSILNFPKSRMNVRLRMQINEMKREVLKYQQKVMECERKLSKKRFLRKSKISTLPLSMMTSQRSSLQSTSCLFDWDFILKFVN